MTDTSLEAVLRQDKLIIAACMTALTVMAWCYVLWLARSMNIGDMAMSGMEMGAGSHDMVMAPEPRSWTMTEFAVMFSMWVIMMIGMMTPSASPMILLYARVGRQSALQGKPLAATGFFLGGYLLAWASFSLVATLAQWALENMLLLTPAMTSASKFFSGILLIAVGLFQWTPLKDVCLKQCQAPIVFIQRHGGFRRHPLGSLDLGFRHGLYCVGCCWALMGLLFVGGIMNILWIAAIAIFILTEKLVANGHRVSRLFGLGLCAAGVWVIGRAVF